MVRINIWREHSTVTTCCLMYKPPKHLPLVLYPLDTKASWKVTQPYLSLEHAHRLSVKVLLFCHLFHPHFFVIE